MRAKLEAEKANTDLARQRFASLEEENINLLGKLEEATKLLQQSKKSTEVTTKELQIVQNVCNNAALL